VVVIEGYIIRRAPSRSQP